MDLGLGVTFASSISHLVARSVYAKRKIPNLCARNCCGEIAFSLVERHRPMSFRSFFRFRFWLTSSTTECVSNIMQTIFFLHLKDVAIERDRRNAQKSKIG